MPHIAAPEPKPCSKKFSKAPAASEEEEEKGEDDDVIVPAKVLSAFERRSCTSSVLMIFPGC